MSLPASTRLGPYTILSRVGAGGMGEVYRAKDTRLDRIVAIKVISAALADNPRSRQRFEREARAVSSLSHPHICVLHDVGSQDGIEYLVMEYLEGESLSARLSKGPLPVQQALQFAIHIADALAAAHRQGIVHRDLKPGNIMLTRSGAKLMDFGLAKLCGPEDADPVPLNSAAPTVTESLTQTGTIVGTFQYIAPEQLQGKVADARADIFAFGAMLYEMMTGRKAFEGDTQASVMGAILHATPAPLAQLLPLTPLALDRLINACLAKDPDERWQAARDVELELRWIQAAQPSSGASATGLKKRERTLWGLATLVLLVALATGWIVAARRSVRGDLIRLTALPPQDESLVFSTNQGGIAISPDERILAFVATSHGPPMLWIRPLDSMVAKPLSGSEGGYYPFWSPDSRSLGFFAGGKLKVIDIQGGLPRTLSDAPEGRGGTWNRDGVIVFGPGFGPLYRVSAAGGKAVPITRPDTERRGSGPEWPSFLPDGHHFLYFYAGENRENDALFVASVDATPETQKPVRVVAANSNGLYSPPHNGRPGYLLFAVDRTLTAQQFDPGSLKIEGDPIPLAEDPGYLANIRLENFSLSATGLMVYGAKRNLPQVTWVGRDGKPLGVLGAPGDFHFLSLSPDEKRVAVVAVDAGTVAMWMIDTSRGTKSRFSVDINTALAPRWSSDSQQIAFSHFEKTTEKWNIFRQSVNGTAAAERLTRSENVQILDDWSGDGRYLIYSEQAPGTRGDLWVLPLTGEGKPFPYLATPFNERHAKFAPEPGGATPRWVAYASDETGTDEVYVQSFPTPGTKVRISANGGVQPRWRRDGKELFYLAPDGTIMAAALNMTASGFQAETPVALCRPPIAPLPAIFASVFEVSADGRRFLILAPSSSDTPGINVVANWEVGLKR